MSQWLTIKPPLHQIAIVGQVNDGETENALRDVSVEITEKPPKFQRYCQLQSLQYGSQWDKMKQRCDLTYTSIDGYFYFADIPDGNYKLTFSIPHKGTRYGSTSVQTQVVRDAKGNINRTQNPENPAILNISLIPTTLKGHILDVEGKAIANAKIQIEGTQETTISNSEGKYRFTQLEVSSSGSNQRQLTLSISGYGYSPITQTTTIQQGTITVLDFTLEMTNKE